VTSAAGRKHLSAVTDEGSNYIDQWANELERGRWPAWIMDGDLVLRYASTEGKAFMSASVGSEVDDAAAGVGLNIFDALVNDAWRSTISPESLAGLLPRVMGYLKDEFRNTTDDPASFVPEQFMPFYEAATDVDSFGMLSDRFDYTVPDLPELPVEFLLFGIRGRDGELLGVVCVSQMGVRPTLVSLLSRGDERMFERMADLQEPKRCQGAILFADLQGSSRLSRMLPTSTYFSFIRSLATAADAAIASNGGVVGRHAGDGVSGFFLLAEGEASTVAASAIRAAREIHGYARSAIDSVVEEAGVEPDHYGMNIGLHWGTSLYMGQLVPGGRLDVTALGDSVNECARIEEAARGGCLLASKQITEQLSAADAASVGVDLDALLYKPVGEMDGVSAKAIQDAGLIPVTKLA
jgi:class 3 adenylate cyclase